MGLTVVIWENQFNFIVAFLDLSVHSSRFNFKIGHHLARPSPSVTHSPIVFHSTIKLEMFNIAKTRTNKWSRSFFLRLFIWQSPSFFSTSWWEVRCESTSSRHFEHLKLRLLDPIRDCLYEMNTGVLKPIF